jgi:rod shape-determining protein MreD
LVNRNGLRALVFGTGNPDVLTIPYLTAAADIKEGDLLVSSGMGGTFPPSYPVATVAKIENDPNEAFLKITARPVAKLNHSKQVLLIWPGGTKEPFRPDWVSLVLIYWCMAAPERVGVGTGFVVGIVLDTLYGSILGLHALAKSLTAYLAIKTHLKLRMFPRLQQAIAIGVLLVLNQLLILWIRGMLGKAPTGIGYWTPSIVGMVVWPWLFVILRDVRRRFRVA